MPSRSVGMRLNVSGASTAVGEVERMAEANKALAASFREVEAAARGASRSVEASGLQGDALAAQTAAQRESSMAVKESAVATDVALASSGKRVEALDNETKSLKNLETGWAGFSTKVSELGAAPFVRKLSMFGGLGLAGTIYESFKQYSNIRTQMLQLAAQAGVQMSRVGPLTQGVFDVGKETGQNLSSVAKGMFYIASSQAGLNATNKELIQLTKSAAQLNMLGNVDQSQAVQTYRLLGNLTVARKQGMQGLGRGPNAIPALLNAAVGTGDITMGNLLTAVGRGMIPVTEALHGHFNQMLAWTDVLTKMGMQPGQIGTLLSHAAQQLPGLTTQNRKVQELLGITPGTMASLFSKQGPAAAMQYLVQHMGKLSPVSYFPSTGGQPMGAASANKFLQNQGFSQQMISAWMQGNLNSLGPDTQNQFQQLLLGMMFGGARQELPLVSLAENLPLYNKVMTYINKHATNAEYQKDVAIAQGSPHVVMQKFVQAVGVLEYQIGKEVAPWIQRSAKILASIAGFLTDHKALLKAILEGVTALVVASTAMVAYNKLILPGGKALGGLARIAWTRGLGFSWPGGAAGGAGAASEEVAAAGTQEKAATTQMSAAELMARNAERFAELMVGPGRAGSGTTIFPGSNEKPTPGGPNEGEVVAEDILAAGAVGGGLLSRLKGFFTGRSTAIKGLGEDLMHRGFRGFGATLIYSIFQNSISKLIGKSASSIGGDTVFGAGFGGWPGAIAGTLFGLERYNPIAKLTQGGKSWFGGLWHQIAGLGSVIAGDATGLGHTFEHWYDDILGRHPHTPQKAQAIAQQNLDQQTQNAKTMKAAAQQFDGAVQALIANGVPAFISASSVARANSVGMRSQAARSVGAIPVSAGSLATILGGLA